jgi:hypothetical protein
MGVAGAVPFTFRGGAVFWSRLSLRGYMREQATREESNGGPVPAGSDVSAGTYRCTNCGNTIDVDSIRSLPPCPRCANWQWNTMSGGGGSAQDPYRTAEETHWSAPV